MPSALPNIEASPRAKMMVGADPLPTPVMTMMRQVQSPSKPPKMADLAYYPA